MAGWAAWLLEEQGIPSDHWAYVPELEAPLDSVVGAPEVSGVPAIEGFEAPASEDW